MAAPAATTVRVRRTAPAYGLAPVAGGSTVSGREPVGAGRLASPSVSEPSEQPVAAGRRLAVMAHYDPDGQLAPHAARTAAALATVADRVLLVSTAGLTGAARELVPAGVELLERENSGYDFGSWKAGLTAAGVLDEWDADTEVVVCNDSCVGPLVPYEQLFDAMAGRDCDFWGITRTLRRGLHVQSFFVVFRPWVTGSQAFRRFWTEMEPLSDRRQVIARHEVGLSAALHAAGFASDSYFREDATDRALARRRHLWWAAQAAAMRPRGSRAAALRRMPREPWNPMAALADRALHGARLPVVKLDTLRYDPYRLGSAVLLERCERAYPAAFAGVGEHLARTGGSYVRRPMEPGSADGRSPAVLRLAPGLAYG